MKEEFDFYSRTAIKSYNLDKTMRYQLAMLDSLDVYTRKHCENVANITCRLCEYLHLDEGFTIYTTVCAYLHDLGKMFIPPSILQKTSKLTDEEFEVMKTHTTIGYNMCMKDLKLRPYAAGALYHHEALNGSGYPQGLTKKDIPYEAQIIRVADEFEAISAKRQYKTHIGIIDTLNILIENSEPVKQQDGLKMLVKDAKVGKIDKKILKALFKVIADDTEYEIYERYTYLDYVKKEIQRLENAEKYYKGYEKAKSEKNKEYYKAGVEMYLKAPNESIENFKFVLEEYRISLKERMEIINRLKGELKQIKKLRV
ncbi:MAG: HD domain-containing protein [Clostridia bacterium]|nr:HD domain-containing protein [Clostridia bacterium]MBR3152208.1 HD domain-containing protein [Clostridia bacterium]MBR3152255.1 HD domain-containing protein [Clostridia bacterium]